MTDSPIQRLLADVLRRSAGGMNTSPLEDALRQRRAEGVRQVVDAWNQDPIMRRAMWWINGDYEIRSTDVEQMQSWSRLYEELLTLALTKMSRPEALALLRAATRASHDQAITRVVTRDEAAVRAYFTERIGA